MNTNRNEKVKDFNQIFITLLNRIPDKPTEAIQIELYTTTLLSPIAMFVKREENKLWRRIFWKLSKLRRA